MKYVVAALLGAGMGVAAAAPPEAPPPLRQALQAFRPGAGAPPPEWGPDQRAQLRRQLSDFGRTPAPSRGNPPQRGKQ